MCTACCYAVERLAAAAPARCGGGNARAKQPPPAAVKRVLLPSLPPPPLSHLDTPNLPLDTNKTTHRRVLAKLHECNGAARKELDWVGQTEAINDARRLVAHHAHVLAPPAALHALAAAAAPAVEQLRSCTARAAMTLFAELFAALGPRCDRELDEVAPLLIKKAGEVSTAGRDNFLGLEADRALASMRGACGEARAAAALLGCAGARAAAARAKAAAHLAALVEAGGAARLAAGGAAGQALLERLFRAGAAFLEEAAPEARAHGRRLLRGIAAAAATRGDVERLLACVKPDALRRRAAEALDAPPPSPQAAAAAAPSAAAAGSPAQRARMGEYCVCVMCVC